MRDLRPSLSSLLLSNSHEDPNEIAAGEKGSTSHEDLNLMVDICFCVLMDYFLWRSEIEAYVSEQKQPTE
ncbi:hypothetical protein ACHQM5_007161 [Ranunculus cassubicifolius]